MPSLPRGIRFIEGPGAKKYTAILPNGKKVNFGDRNYEQYEDSVPIALGGGLWSHKDHKDPIRRKNYRTRHGGMRCKNGDQCIAREYTPAWFSYYF